MTLPSNSFLRGAAMTALYGTIAFAIAGSAPGALAANAAPGAHSLLVSGEGKAMGKPDQAQLSAGVMTQAPTAAAALAANNAAMNRIFTTIKALGIPDNKIQTSNFSVTPQYPPYNQTNPQPHRITGYDVSNQVTIIVDDLGKLGAALDALVKSGSNQLNSVSFAIANPAPLNDKALRAAVADAAAKAKGIAQAAGVSLGPIISIEEGTSFTPGPRPMMMMRAGAAAEVPIATGEDTVSATVTITYSIQ
jgi:uncharacterized protein